MEPRFFARALSLRERVPAGEGKHTERSCSHSAASAASLPVGESALWLQPSRLFCFLVAVFSTNMRGIFFGRKQGASRPRKGTFPPLLISTTKATNLQTRCADAGNKRRS
jgi:hypothetical protein